jgi:mono/diheme cytochrome c family protein
MRLVSTTVLLVIAMVIAASCGGPDNAEKKLTAACERQIEQVEAAAHSGSTPTAKSTDERLAAEPLVECAGQPMQQAAAVGEDDAKAGSTEDAEDAKKVDEEAAADDAKDAESSDEDPAELDEATRAAFVTSCGGCHTLSDAETSGAVGPSLDGAKLTAAQVEEILANGKGAMPAGLLSGADAAAMAAYVAAASA